MNLEPAVKYSHTLLKPIIAPGDTVVDATVGNGNDTIFLASLVGKAGHVLGFDIQQQALDETATQLTLTGMTNQVQLIHDGHEHLEQYLAPQQQLAAAIFNLGYLPGGDKRVITHGDKTLSALTACLTHLRRGGIAALVVYYGHPGGEQEKEMVLEYVKRLDQHTYSVLQYGFINQIHEPPFLLAIQKR
ncbi:methyltransferase domain-containing protein [Lactobacillus sp. LC28-10]|uniref:Methyltransferase domain-containing protein n=1 Tax=Secundilactobacillus angelensis TaxID=2722706 RepID=A0ABX1L116_9LACO|nr:class I SAM-dependent methyltransferase [Secundilactobacillus angelensis]MCH5463264.1 methyltransferase domain-containing protein [Secundilactobacillus angelensis]NLR19192.1 methyltransferase domain-containing protein [Secundilactobacillus angelensis]